MSSDQNAGQNGFSAASSASPSSMDWSMREVADVLAGDRKAKLASDHAQRKIIGVSTDTRMVREGDLYVALKGERFDGNRFAEDAMAKGAAGLVLDISLQKIPRFRDTSMPIFFVPDTLKALGDLAHAWRSRFRLPVWAIAGSNGKTTTRSMAATLLSSTFRTHQNPGNLNNLIGVPLTLFGLRFEHQVLVAELGMNRLGEVARLTEITVPTLGAITNIGPEHLELLKNLDTVAEAEGELFLGMSRAGKILINVDDEYCHRLAEKAGFPIDQRITLGWKNQAQVRVLEAREDVRGGVIGSLVRILDQREAPKQEFEVFCPLAGHHNVYNLLTAVAGALALGVSAQAIEEVAPTIQSVGARSRVHRLSGERFLFDDCYNANFASMEASLDAVFRLRAGRPGIAVLGEMLELGEASPDYHRKLGEKAAQTQWQDIFAIGEHASFVAEGARSIGFPARNLHLICDGERGRPSDEVMGVLLERISALIPENSWTLVKGSRGMALERVVEGLRQRFGMEDRTK